MPNLIITGIPRSGTSLATAIIDSAPDTFCLSEPEDQVALMQNATGPDDFVRALEADFARVRRIILSGGSIRDRRDEKGALITNYFSAPGTDTIRMASETFQRVNRGGLSDDFWLGIKHNALYTAVLPQLMQTKRFEVIAVIRDPVNVLISWRSLSIPVSAGRLPAAERFWTEIADLSLAHFELIEKQLRLYDLLCRRFAQWVSSSHVIRYETFSRDPAVLLTLLGFSIEQQKNSPIPQIHTPSDRNDKDIREIILERLRHLTVTGEVPGIINYYPEYSRL